MNNKVLAFIPARANSKGVKNKNIKKLNGKPLVSMTIDFAKNLKFIDYIVVCSDSLKIKKIAEDKKINFILRPDKLSTDESKVESSLIYTLQNFKEANLIEYILLLEPTTSLLRDQLKLNEPLGKGLPPMMVASNIPSDPP